MRLRPHFRRLAVAVIALTSALAVPGRLAVASAAAQTSAGSYQAIAYSPGTGSASGAASATCATSRPHSGAILYSAIRGGLGRLTIKNSPSQDVVVVLVRGRSKAVAVYVRARASTTVGNIKDGTYAIYYTTGSRFSACTGRFTRGAAYGRFNARLSFVSPPGQYTVWTLTLYAVNNGNAQTTQINPSDFPAP